MKKDRDATRIVRVLPQSSAKVVMLSVTGMTCSVCAVAVEGAVKKLPGVVEAAVDVLGNKARVHYDSDFVNEETIREAIEEAGFPASLMNDETRKKTATQTCRIRVVGMTCAACSVTLENVLGEIPGVLRAQVALAIEEAEVEFDPNITTGNQLLTAIIDAGFDGEVTSNGDDVWKVALKVDGLFTETSMKMIEKSLEELRGVESVETDLHLGKVTIAYMPEIVGPRRLIKAVEIIGLGEFKAVLFPLDGGKGNQREKEIKRYWQSFLWSLVFTVPVFFLSMVFTNIRGVKDGLEKKIVNMLSIGAILRWMLTTPVQFFIGRRFYVGAYKSLKNGSASMDVLVALGTNTAYIYSFYAIVRSATSINFDTMDVFETSAMLITFILLGKYIEVLAKGKTSEAITKLMNLTPDTAILLELDEDGDVISEETIDSRLIQKNDVVRVIPGAKIAADGYVIWGESHVNESMITGEAIPVEKKKGDFVIGGTVNGTGVLHVKATKVGSDSAISQIVRLVESAQMAKAPVQKIADRISKYFVPTVVVFSLSTWLAWFIAGKVHSYPDTWVPHSMDRFQLALQFGISVMVIACPCALGLATPTAVMVGTGVAATEGILIKSGHALENAHKVNCIIFDKTGTLTLGKPTVVKVIPLNSMSATEFLKLAAAAEANSEHPLAKSIVEHTKSVNEEESNPFPKADSFVSVTGHGVKATVVNKDVIVGNRTLLLDENIPISHEVEEILREVESNAQTAMLVAVNQVLQGAIAVSDPMKPNAKEVVATLKKMKIRSIMVTGDNWGTANAIAREAGIDSVIAEAKPEHKADKVKSLQAEGSVVAMVGDGINDSPALVAADVGMAIGVGTDIAMEAADVVLMKSDLEDVITAIDLSRKAFGKIKFNYMWALGYNVVGIPIAAGVLYPAMKVRLPPWAAGAAMAASSVSVVVSSLLLKYYKRPSKVPNLETIKVE